MQRNVWAVYVWGQAGRCLCLRNLELIPKKPSMADLSKLSWHLAVWRCVFLSQIGLCWLSSEDWEEEGGFSHQSESRLGKTCLMGAWEIFLGLSGETLERQRRPVKLGTLTSLSNQAVRKRRSVKDLLAQRVGPCFTLNGHTTGGLTQTEAVCSRSELVQLLQEILHGALWTWAVSAHGL